MNFPNDSSITNGGQIHEGKISTALGLKGIPAMAEEIMIDRDISLCEYTESKLHLSYISIKNSVSKIKKAKKQGVNGAGRYIKKRVGWEEGTNKYQAAENSVLHASKLLLETDFRQFSNT